MPERPRRTRLLGRVGDSTQHVLDVAARLFREHGYAETSVRDIAREADMLPGSLHYRFPAKHDLLLALMERAVERTTADVRQAVDGVSDPAERLRLALTTYLQLLLSGDDDLYVLLYDWRSLTGSAGEKVALLHERLHALFDGLFYEAAGAGRIPADVDLHHLRQLWLGGLNWTVQWHTADDDGTIDELADTYWRLLTSGAFSPRTTAH